MLHIKNPVLILFALAVSMFSTQSVYAWSFIVNTLNPPFNQCMTCHTSNSDFTMNPYGEDYLEPSHATKYANKHPSPIAVTGDCNNCHSGKGYPIMRSGLDNMDSDLDLYTNLAEFNAGTFPGDATDFPVDANAPMITAFSLPASSNTLTVSITEFSATDDVGVAGYMVTESSTAPNAGDAGWSATAPAIYTFATADIHTLYAWAKDAAGNVSAGSSAQVDTTPSQGRVNVPPTAAAGNDQTVAEGGTVTLSGFGSSDDLGIISYAWVQLNGPGGSTIASDDPAAVVLSDSSSMMPYFMTPAVGIGGATLTFQLTVTDGDGAQDSAEVTITVNDNGISAFDGMPGVVSTVTTTGEPIGISAAGNNACSQLTTLDLQDMPSSATQPLDLLYGLVDFELLVNDPVNPSITVHFPSPVPAGYKWYKYTAARGWFDFDRNLISGGTGEGAVFNNDRTQVTLYINDNGEYDDDPATGIIRDPGGVASGTSVATLSAGSNSFSGSGGGGCFVQSVLNLSWIDGPTFLFVLALLLLAVVESRYTGKNPKT
ncbi:MAG: hypothetical protein PVH87_16610 [Desulfobacteraceae bacterium]|jgi:hypothetical protein